MFGLGELRNLKGNQSAIAYRDNEDDPFHYVFFSYDARGRVEAIVRWTENIGFDVVHYTYNSMNMVNTVTAIDGLRQFTTWNVYDDNGRLWKVYSKVGAKGFHIEHDNQIDGTDVSFPEPLEKPTKPDITYTYNELGAVSQVKYKSGNDSIFKNVTYNSTGNVTNISVLKNLTTQLFSQSLQRDETGNITQQISQQYNLHPRTDNYTYDFLNRITAWSSQINGRTETATYSYDAIGNFDNNCTKNSNNVSYNYQTKNGKITNMLSYFGIDNRNEMASFFYDNIGAVDSIYGIDQNNVTYYNKFNYSNGSILKSLKSSNSNSGYNNLTFPENESPMTYTHEIWNWNYRTGAFSVREQKRLMTSPHGDTAHKEFSYSQATNYAHFWEYNLVGAGGEELIQYKGFQTASSLAGANGRRVYIAPNQYIVPGGEVRITSDTNAKEIYITDHLGSVRCIVSAPITIKQFDYDPFGAYISSSPDKPRDGFTSAASDIEEGESNFMQMGVRMYSARIGRFLSVDPLHEIMPSHNPYHYAFNSPLVWKDPSGLAPEKDKNIHSEKLQGQFIKLRDLSTPIMPGDEYWVYIKDDRDFYFSAEYDAGFADRPVWAMPSLGGGGSGGGVGSGRSSRSTQANGPRTYDPYNIYESFIGGARKSLRGVQANGKVAQDAVKRSVEDSYEKYIGFDEDGFVQFSKGYVEAAKKAGSASNISKLIDLAQNFYLTISMVKGNTKFDVIRFSFVDSPPELSKPYTYTLDDFESDIYNMSNWKHVYGIFLASKLSFQTAVDLTEDNINVRLKLFFSDMNQLGGTIYLDGDFTNTLHKYAAEEMYLHAYFNFKNMKWWHTGIKNNDNLLKSIFDKAGK